METLLAIVSALLILTVFLSLIRNDFWIFKILEYKTGVEIHAADVA